MRNVKILFVVAILIAFSHGKALANSFVTDLSPAQFSAVYTKIIQHAIETFGEHAAMDYSYFHIKDVFKYAEGNMYFAYINEDYDNQRMNSIVMFGQERANIGGIKQIFIVAEPKLPDRARRLHFETCMTLLAIGAKNVDSNEIEKIVRQSAGTYKFYAANLGRNIYVTCDNGTMKIYTD